jgi:hypothetical protein
VHLWRNLPRLRLKDYMNTPEFILVAILSILLITVFVFIGRGILSAKLGGTIILIAPLFLYFLIVFFWEKGGIINAICVGTLLSLAFGPATFFFGRILEKRVKDKKHGGNGNEKIYY